MAGIERCPLVASTHSCRNARFPTSPVIVRCCKTGSMEGGRLCRSSYDAKHSHPVRCVRFATGKMVRCCAASCGSERCSRSSCPDVPWVAPTLSATRESAATPVSACGGGSPTLRSLPVPATTPLARHLQECSFRLTSLPVLSRRSVGSQHPVQCDVAGLSWCAVVLSGAAREPAPLDFAAFARPRILPAPS